MALWLKLIPKLQLSGSDHTSPDHSVLHMRKYLRSGGRIGGNNGGGEDHLNLLLAEPNLAYGSQQDQPQPPACHESSGANLSSGDGGITTTTAVEAQQVLSPQRALVMLVSFGLVLVCGNIWFWLCFVVRKRTVICCLTNDGGSGGSPAAARQKALSEESDLAAIGIISSSSGGGGVGTIRSTTTERRSGGSFKRRAPLANGDSSVWYDNLDTGTIGMTKTESLSQCSGSGGRFGTIERCVGTESNLGIAMISNGQVSRATNSSAASSTPVGGPARSELQQQQTACRASRTLPREQRCGATVDCSSSGPSRDFFARTVDFSPATKAPSQEQLIGSSCSSSSGGGGGAAAVRSHEDLELRSGEPFPPEQLCRPKLSTFCQGEPPSTPAAAAGRTATAASRAHVTMTAARRGSDRFLLPAESV